MRNETGVIVLWNVGLYSLLKLSKKAHPQPRPGWKGTDFGFIKSIDSFHVA